MKNGLIGIALVVMASPALATFDMDCGRQANGKHEVALHIEDDGSAVPQHWDLLLNGKKPFCLTPMRIKNVRGKIDVTVNDGGDSVWTDYKFRPQGECDGETYSSKVEIYRRYVNRSELLKTLTCSCTED